MKINQAIDALKAGTSSVAGPRGEKPEPAPEKTRAAVAGGDKSSLNISTLSTRLQTLESRLATGEAFDAARVSEIRQAIRDGSFKVNADAVADKLLATAHDLFVKRH